MVAGLPRDNGEIVHDDIQQNFFLLSRVELSSNKATLKVTSQLKRFPRSYWHKCAKKGSVFLQSDIRQQRL